MAQEEDILLGITEEHNRNLDKLGPAVKGKKNSLEFLFLGFTTSFQHS